VLTKAGDDAETLGVRRWAELKGYIKTVCLTANNKLTAKAEIMARMLQMK
jgi:hypothetical protein